MDFYSSDCYVAFVDILGFKELVKRKSVDKIVNMFKKIDHFNRSNGIYYNIDNELKPVLPKSEIHYKMMSDSVVIYVDAKVQNALQGLIMYCSFFQSNLLTVDEEPILCRGGISRGELYVDGEIIIGGGLVAAYELESKAAIFPRVIIPKRIVDERGSEMLHGHNVYESVENEDGFYVTNYIKNIIYSNKGDEKLFKKLQKYTYDNLSSCYDNRIRDKYLYFEKHCNKWIESKKEMPFE